MVPIISTSLINFIFFVRSKVVANNCEGNCKREVGCETALRAVRDGFIGGFFGMALLPWLL